jgi:ABC-type polysaccharide/polyol phosphate export permease
LRTAFYPGKIRILKLINIKFYLRSYSIGELKLISSNQLTKAYQDIYGACKQWRIWVLLGWQDIQLRYRRSILGPFWLTLSMAITIYSMGFLYGHLFKMDLQTYLPYLAAGIVSWNLISISLTESTDIFMHSEAYIKQIKLPFFCFIFRMIFRNTVIFLHNLVAFLPLIFVLHIPLTWHILLIFPAMIIVAFNIAMYGSVLAVIGTRYRDISQIIVSLIQVVFFLTPIMWTPALLPDRYTFAVQYNPFAHFVNLLREPLLGQALSSNTLIMVSVFTALGFILFNLLFTKARSKIVYWL